MKEYLQANEQVQLHNIWVNAFNALDIAFKGDDIRKNLQDVIKLQIKSSPFEDIQIYKYDKKNNVLVAAAYLDEENPLITSMKYENVVGQSFDLKDEHGKHNVSITRFAGENNHYIMLIKHKNPITTTPELYCEEVIKKTWVRIVDTLETQDKIKKAYLTDPVTNVGNRAGYAEYVKNIFNNSKIKRELTYSLADLFGLKYINDNYGHNAGDRYIKTAADCIREQLDEEDKLFRTGGDEFAIISGRLKKTEMIEKFANANLKLSKENFGYEIPFPLNINYGVYEGEEDIDTFVDKAEIRMKRQKTKTYKKLNIKKRDLKI